MGKLMLIEPPSLKPLYWMGSTLKDLRDSPEEVKDGIGYTLELVQKGERPANAKPLKGFGGASVLEIVEDFDGDTWRAVYTVAIANAVYVLHFFQKKSKKGIATPKKEIELIKQRLRDAVAHGKTGKA
jgi:phage-related protein